MRLSGLSLLVLKALYQAEEQRGDVVELLNKGKSKYSVDQIQGACEELEKYGPITEYTPARTYAPATLSEAGIDLVEQGF